MRGTGCIMVISHSPKGSFLFGQNTEDGMCHMSFSVEHGEVVNLQIPVEQIPDMIANLARVLAADRSRLMFFCPSA